MPHSLLPKFSEINPATIVSDLKKILRKNRQELNTLLKGVVSLDWSLMEKLDDLNDRIQRFWSPISHLHAVKQTPELRKAYNDCLPLLSAYGTELAQNKTLYLKIKTLANSNYPFNYAQEKCLKNELRDFHLSGIDLPPEQQKRYREILAQLAQLANQFEENLLDATSDWSKVIENKADLAGLPDYIIDAMEKAAKAKGLTGYLLTIDAPCYFPLLTYADNRLIREKLYKAYVTRASELDNSQYDNGPILLQIVHLRCELSRLLGFSNYAQKSLASNKMANSPNEVINFLENILMTAQGKAKEEWKELNEFASQRDQIEDLQPWDIFYYREKLREKKFGISEDALRCYFPLEKVLEGMFTLINRLFGVQIYEMNNVDVWSPDVRFFSIVDQEQQVRGQFYMDLYAKPEKREGAWMDDFQSRRRLDDGALQIPIAFLTCNFSPPLDGKQVVLLTLEDVLTLFHEFGHCLQHLLTTIDYEGVSGINGVSWDAVELPSQFMEYFVWEKPVLDLISSHYQTKKPLPLELVEKMRAARNFHAGLKLLRQIELSLLDFRLYTEFDPLKGPNQVQALADQIRRHINITPYVSFNRFQNGFSHIFAGGYAAGYYSYLWAEVLACDAFAKFLEDGLFNAATGKAFLQTILEQGGAVDAIILFEEFRGRPPKIQAFLSYFNLG